jgi:hypothetical protein
VVVGDQQDGGGQAQPQPVDQLVHLLLQAGVQAAERLVEEQHARFGGQRTGQRDPLLLPAGERAGRPPVEAGQLHQLEELTRPPPRRPARNAPDAVGEGDVVGDVQVREKQRALEHHRHAPPLRGRAGQVDAVEGHRAGVRLLQTGDHPQQRALARAGRAEDRQAGAGRHLQVDVGERPLLVRRVPQGQRLHAQVTVHIAACRPRRPTAATLSSRATGGSVVSRDSAATWARCRPARRPRPPAEAG